MNIDNLTYGALKQIANLFNNTQPTNGLNDQVGEKVIVRTYSGCVPDVYQARVF